jgi:16S rRNA processing protein RimM
MNTTPDKTLIVIASIGGAFGVRGEVKLRAFTAEPKACLTYGPLRDEQGKIVLTPKSSRIVKKALALWCEEITTREQAEAIKGTQLYVYRSDMPDTGEDEYYYSDLAGLRVETLGGKTVGTIKAVHNFGAGDLLEISPSLTLRESGEKDYYLSFSLSAVPRVDIKGGRVVIDPPAEIMDEVGQNPAQP